MPGEDNLVAECDSILTKQTISQDFIKGSYVGVNLTWQMKVRSPASALGTGSEAPTGLLFLSNNSVIMWRQAWARERLLFSL